MRIGKKFKGFAVQYVPVHMYSTTRDNCNSLTYVGQIATQNGEDQLNSVCGQNKYTVLIEKIICIIRTMAAL